MSTSVIKQKMTFRKLWIWRFGYETRDVYVYFYPSLGDSVEKDGAREISHYGKGYKFIKSKYISGDMIQKIRVTYRRKI